MTPAMNSWTIDASASAPYKIIGIEGGMMIASDADEEVTAAANVGWYFFRFIAGISTDPIAATSATADPEISAKNSDTPTFTMARPPRTKPISAAVKSISRREMPPVFMRAPARMKSGIAISGKLVAPSKIVSAAS